MRTTRILKRMSAAIAALTAVVAVALFALTNASAEVPNGPGPIGTTVPTLPPTTVTPPRPEPPRPPTPTVPEPVPTPDPTPDPTPAPETTTPETTTLRPGATGPEVLALQQRLRGLGYWLGTPDGTYGGLTVQAVMAFQKVEGMERDGIAGAATIAALDDASRPAPASPGGDLVEVDKARQVLFVVRDGAVRWVLNVSTGTEEPYWVNGRTEMADTPAGRWQVAWAVDGLDVGELGGLYRPRYFHGDGIAVHGYTDVPAYPASHGCVRVSNAAMDWIWAEGLMPVGSPVWVY